MEHAINSDDQTDFSNGRAQMAVDLDLVAKREPSTAGRVDLRVAAQGNGKFKPPRSRRKNAEPDEDASKRRCISTACVACRYGDLFSWWILRVKLKFTCAHGDHG